MEENPNIDIPHYDALDNRQWDYLQRRYRMTERELQVAKLVCSGIQNEEIASALDICLGTVKTHIRNIYRKAWVNNKVSMLLRFMAVSKEMD